MSQEDENAPSDPEQCNSCHFCEEIPENFITLKCMHDICIQCTAQNLKQDEENEGTADEFKIVCPKCGQETAIEEETVHNIIQLIDNEGEEEEDGEEAEGGMNEIDEVDEMEEETLLMNPNEGDDLQYGEDYKSESD